LSSLPTGFQHTILGIMGRVSSYNLRNVPSTHLA
jgi:hypothetical protein